MGNLIHVPLPTGGKLDTSVPAADLAPGQLVSAVDLAHRFWGPRQCRARLANYPSSTGYTGLRFYGVDGEIVFPYHGTQMDLGLQFTADCAFTCDALQTNDTTIFCMDYDTTNMALYVALQGSGGGDPGTPIVYVRGTGGGNATLNGTTVIGTDTGLHTIRVVRNGTLLYLYVDGELEDTASGFSSGVSVAAGSAGEGLVVGRKITAEAPDSWWSGYIYQVNIRPGAFTDARVIHALPNFPRAQSFRFVTRPGPRVTGDDMCLDLSRFGNHGTIGGTVTEVELRTAGALVPACGIGHFIDGERTDYNVVLAGGRLDYGRIS